MAALASALAADKDEAAAKALAVKAWVEYDIPAGQEPTFLRKVGSCSPRPTTSAASTACCSTTAAGPASATSAPPSSAGSSPLLSEPEKKKAQARLAVFLRAKNSDQLMAKLPPQALSTEWGLAIQRAQALRRQKKDEAAWKILLAEPEATLVVKPDGWWEERRASAYAALKAGKAKTAYELVRDPGRLSVNASKDAAFLAGWLALRHLQRRQGGARSFPGAGRSRPTAR